MHSLGHQVWLGRSQPSAGHMADAAKLRPGGLEALGPAGIWKLVAADLQIAWCPNKGTERDGVSLDAITYICWPARFFGRDGRAALYGGASP